MENLNLIQSSTRKRKLSSFLRDDEEYYIPKRKQKPTPAPSPPTQYVFKKPEPKIIDTGSSMDAIKKENESLMALCSELNDANKKLQHQNVELHEKLIMQRGLSHGSSVNVQEIIEHDPNSDEDFLNYPIGILNVETLADLWNDVCKIPIPSCSCSTKINAVAKKRVTQRITPLITL